jgi:hypothetical protein
LDADQTGDDSDAVADGVQYSIGKLCFRGSPVGNSQCTDQGGGGTVERVIIPLVNLDVLADYSLIANCTIHNINNEQKVATKKALLSDSLNKANNEIVFDRDVEQLMYAAYAWEKEAGKAVMKEFWDVILENVSDISDTYNEDDDDNKRNYEFTMMVDEKGRKFIGLKHGCETRW